MYRSPHQRKPPKRSVPEGMTAGLTERVSIIASAKVRPSDDIEFTSPRVVGGYNWIDNEANEPIIAVPGLPAVWTGKDGHVGQLEQDCDIEGYIQYGDHHGARTVSNGLSRYEPIFHALDSPDDLRGVKLITDRNSLRKIYGLFTPDAMYGPKPFRIDAQKFGNVILLARWEQPGSRVPILPHPFCWSQSHQLATSRYQLEGSKSCHRIVRYGFGGIEIMVRFELDSVTEAAPLEGSTNDNIIENSDDVDDLTDVMRDTTVNDRLLPLPKCTEIKSGIKIHQTKYPPPPLSSFIETKTRSARGELDYVDIYGQLAFSQTPNLFVARHSKGYFQTLERISLGEGILEDIAEATQETMAKTAGMIKEMMDTVEDFGEVTFVWSGEGTDVEVWKGTRQIAPSEAAREMLLAA